MADEVRETARDDGGPAPWRALWVSAAALLATLALIALIFMITWSNRARDEALDWGAPYERSHAADPNHRRHVRQVEAALGRYVLDEDRDTGTAYFNEWRNAEAQIAQLQRSAATGSAQARRVAELRTLFVRRNGELAPAARRRAAQGRRRPSYLYQATSSPTLPALRSKRRILRGPSAQPRAADARDTGLRRPCRHLYRMAGLLAILSAPARSGSPSSPIAPFSTA
jgi:FtsZ-interacting cell division protein ZipA